MKKRTFISPLGPICLTEEDGFLTDVGFCTTKAEAAEDSPLLAEAEHQLAEYFLGLRQNFDLPLNPKGTAFQQKVWQALLQIPYGQTASYKEIACKIGNEKACRAVGLANHNNPIGIIIPCHRVVGANGNLTGYAGGLEKKQKLLELEQRVISNQKA